MTIQFQSRQSTFNVLRGIWRHLETRRRLQFGMLLLVMVASGLAELISLGAVLPFLHFLSDPDYLKHQLFLRIADQLPYFTDRSESIVFLTFLFTITAILATSVRLSSLWLNGRFVAAVGSDLSCKTYWIALNQPYETHIKTNSSSVISSITTHIYTTVVSLNSLLLLLTSSFVAISILFGVLLVNLSLAIGSFIFFGIIYLIIGILSRSILRCNGLSITENTNLQLKVLQEGFGSIRDIIIDSAQLSYLEKYQAADRPLRRLQSVNLFLRSFPRFSLEAMCMIFIAVIASSLALTSGDLVDFIPLLGVLVLASQRLLPALQSIYSGWAFLKSSTPSIVEVLTILDQPVLSQPSVIEPFNLRHSIRFQSTSFSYSVTSEAVLHALNCEIKAGECIGVFGTTGSGKSTFADVLMGLLRPTSGRLLVDGRDIYDVNELDLLHSWRACIAHVPQNIFLVDGTIAENIALGTPKNHIDLNRVRSAAAKAQIDEFIESTPQGYEMTVGENGIRLSGGQRQRIAVARALYKRASVLIFDEATSALDSFTERRIIKSIQDLSTNLTVVIIAHRLAALEHCDRLLHIERGKLINEGPPQILLNSV